MKQVFQTIIDKGNGNCMQAAIASLLDLTLDEVPHFKEYGTEWADEMMSFLSDNGYEFYGTIRNGRHPQYKHHFFDKMSEHKGVNGLFFASVYSPAFYDANDETPTTHAVIIDKNFNIVHDPNPNYQDNMTYPLADEIGYNGIKNYFLIEPEGGK